MVKIQLLKHALRGCLGQATGHEGALLILPKLDLRGCPEGSGSL